MDTVREAVAHSSKDMVDEQHQVGHIGELKSCQPSTLVDIDFVIDDGNEVEKKIRSKGKPDGYQRLLTDASPRRMANTHEDGLQ